MCLLWQMSEIVNTYKRRNAVKSVEKTMLIVHLLFAYEAIVKFGVKI